MGACLSAPSREEEEHRRNGRRPDGQGKAPARVEFGYDRDFDARYDVGRLLGHGQFAYTFASGGRVAVKRIDKAKVVKTKPPPSLGWALSSIDRPVLCCVWPFVCLGFQGA
jgi:hypothetical protein